MKKRTLKSRLACVLALSLLMNLAFIAGVSKAFADSPDILINYNFDDENAVDSSGHGNNGTVAGAVSYADHDGGKALVLNGSGWIELPRNLVYNNQQFTVEVSFKTTSTQVGIFGYQNTAVNGSPNAFVPIISIDKNGKLYTEMYTTTQMVVASSDAVNDGAWHRVTLTSDNASIKVYLDGQFLGSQAGSVNHFNMTYNQVGTNAAWSRDAYFDLATYEWTPYTGMLDDFVFYPTAKTGAEIAKTAQTISFGEIADKTTGDGAFALSATASSGLAVTYSSSDTDVATISGSTVTIEGAGTTNITANQAGNDTYSAAPPVTRPLTVTEAAPTAEELANESIAEAKDLVPASFTATEGTDTNLLTYLNALAGMSDTGVTLSLTSSNANVGNDGAITYGATSVTENVLVHINKASGTEDTKTIAVTVPAHTMTDAEAVAGAKADLDAGDLSFGGTDTAAEVTQDFTLPLSGSNGTTISWAEKTDAGDNLSLSGGTATIVRPAYGQGDKTVVLTATITKNAASDTKDISVTIKEEALQQTTRNAPRPSNDTLELTGQTVKDMEADDAVLEITSGTSTYSLPATQINIDAISASLGEQVELADITVHVAISEPPAAQVRIIEDHAAANSYQIVVEPVEFTITCTSGERTVEVSKFKGYVERTVAIPAGIDPYKITTGVVLNSDGTFTHIPTQIVIIDGKYYAKMSSLTNSTYSVIYNPFTFSDLDGYWAEDMINNMGARLVVKGTDDNMYEPELAITRAEFATMTVRALGLTKEEGCSQYKDVDPNEWYCGYIKTASSYGLINGYEIDEFGPNDKIIREDALVIISRAMELAGMQRDLSDQEIDALLLNFKDVQASLPYIRRSIAACLNSGIINGRYADAIEPKDYITRAEVAVILHRMLVNADLI